MCNICWYFNLTFKNEWQLNESLFYFPFFIKIKYSFNIYIVLPTCRLILWIHSCGIICNGKPRMLSFHHCWQLLPHYCGIPKNVFENISLMIKSLLLYSELFKRLNVFFSSVQSHSRVRLFATPWIAAGQASLSITNSRSSLRLASIESVMPSSHLILCCPLLLLPPIPPSIRVFSNESTLRMRGPKYWSYSVSIIPSKEIPGLISFRMDWLYWYLYLKSICSY